MKNFYFGLMYILDSFTLCFLTSVLAVVLYGPISGMTNPVTMWESIGTGVLSFTIAAVAGSAAIAIVKTIFESKSDEKVGQ